jgi:hypothetical protein
MSIFSPLRCGLELVLDIVPSVAYMQIFLPEHAAQHVYQCRGIAYGCWLYECIMPIDLRGLSCVVELLHSFEARESSMFGG